MWYNVSLYTQINNVNKKYNNYKIESQSIFNAMKDVVEKEGISNSFNNVNNTIGDIYFVKNKIQCWACLEPI